MEGCARISPITPLSSHPGAHRVPRPRVRRRRALRRVPRFWSELKAQMHEEPHEFVDDWSQNGLGTGVLQGEETRRLSAALSPRGA